MIVKDHRQIDISISLIPREVKGGGGGGGGGGMTDCPQESNP